MKSNVKLLAVLLISLVLLAVGGTVALAADYEHCADTLNDLGLFSGSANGYELDRQATRAEAAIMLVRLLGAEKEAVDGAFSHPFTDVPDWASSYVGYMYEEGLTKGVSATTFDPQGMCDLRMYSAFVLRALGYAGDFEYAEAETFAIKLGVVDIISAAGEFTRDNLAAISYTALFVPTKGTDTMLLAQLIEQGVVTAEAAQPSLDFYAAYAQTQTAAAKMSGAGDTPEEIKLDVAMNMGLGEIGAADIKLDSLLQMDAAGLGNIAPTDIAAILGSLDKIKFAMTNKVTVAGIPDSEDMAFQFDMYLIDGVLYLNTDVIKLLTGSVDIPNLLKLDIKTVLPMLGLDADTLTQMMPSFDSIFALMPEDPYAPYYGIHMIKSIEVTELADGSKRYDMGFAGFSNDLMQSLLTMLYGGMPELMEMANQMEIAYNIHSYSYTFDKDGNMKSMNINMDVTEKMFVGTADEVAVSMKMQMNYELTKTGKDVKITLPGKAEDYADIMELLGAMMTPQPEPLPEQTVQK